MRFRNGYPTERSIKELSCPPPSHRPAIRRPLPQVALILQAAVNRRIRIRQRKRARRRSTPRARTPRSRRSLVVGNDCACRLLNRLRRTRHHRYDLKFVRDAARRSQLTGDDAFMLKIEQRICERISFRARGSQLAQTESFTSSVLLTAIAAVNSAIVHT